MITVGAFEAKTHLSQLLSEVELKNENVLIRRRGKDIAVIIPAADYKGRLSSERQKAIMDGFDQIRRNSKRLRPGEIKEFISAGRKW